MLKITTKLPNPALFPNRKNGGHWTKTNMFKKQDQHAGFYDTKGTLVSLPIESRPKFTALDNLQMTILAIYGDNRHRDADNILAAFKAIQDGMCMALGIDDKQIQIVTIDKTNKDKNSPRCEILLELI
jgi:crossover junction endodeoxyribonuclease RusA